MMFEPSGTLNYKRWVIKARIKKLENLLKLFPNSPSRSDREIELDNLKRDLES